MTRDYKKPMRSKKKPLPGWVWLFTGLGIGLFVSLLVWLKDRPESASASIVQQSREEIRSRTSRVEEMEEEKPRFDFYTLLPELEVVIPEGDYEVEPVRQPKTSTSTQSAPEEPGSYRLQAGSFKSLEEAERRVGELMARQELEVSFRRKTFDLRPLIGNRIYGCDDCQLVCPWNRFARPTREADFAVRHGLDATALVELFGWSNADF